jgi:FkbM family methyltransferase
MTDDKRKAFAKTSYGQQGEDLVLKRIIGRILKLPNDYKGFYLDIGAYHPFSDSVTLLLYDQGWEGICVDMSVNSIKLFEENRPRDVLVCAAAGEADGTVEAYFLGDEISVSNTCDAGEAARLRKIGKTLVARTVPVLSPNTILARYAPHRHSIDFVNIDVEGFELAVLRGLDLERYRPSVVALEIHAKDVLSALASDVSSYITSKGYRCLGSTVITYFYVRD